MLFFVNTLIFFTGGLGKIGMEYTGMKMLQLIRTGIDSNPIRVTGLGTGGLVDGMMNGVSLQINPSTP